MRSPSPFDNDSDANESFEVLHTVVVTLVHLIFSGPIGPADEDDVVQETSIKVWVYWKTRPIFNPWAFVRRVVYTVIIDMQRRFKPSLFQEWPRDEFGEINELALLAHDPSLQEDPEWIAVQEESYDETLNRMADAIAELHRCQQNAAICTLKARVDEWSRMAAALEARGVSADLEWPDDQVEKKRLQASFSPARRNIVRYLSEGFSRMDDCNQAGGDYL
jgi:DNA-directed RNA polymerase specialized sigma24 family protein